LLKGMKLRYPKTDKARHEELETIRTALANEKD
jgi:hypothetical protein